MMPFVRRRRSSDVVALVMSYTFAGAAMQTTILFSEETRSKPAAGETECLQSCVKVMYSKLVSFRMMENK